MNKTLTLEITAVYDKLKSALSSIASLFKDAFDFTKAEIQFNRLLGDFDKAKKLVRELREAGKTGAFGFAELAGGMKNLLKYSGGDLGTDTLNKLADFAAATDTPLDSLTKTFGRFYQSLSTGGTDFERTVRELENFGLITKDLKTQLIEMGAQGTPAIEIWKLINQQLQKFNGVNDELTQTTQGRLEKFGNELKDIGVKLIEALIPAIEALFPYIEAAIPYIQAVGQAIKDYLTDPEKKDWVTPEPLPDLSRGVPVTRRGPNGQLITEYVKGPRQTPIEAALQNVTVDTSKPVKQETKKVEGYSKALSDAMSEITKDYNDQLRKVKNLDDALKNLSQTMTQAYASSLTTTGKIGGYQSQAEQARAAATFNPELNELQVQTEILKNIRDNAKTQYGLTL